MDDLLCIPIFSRLHISPQLHIFRFRIAVHVDVFFAVVLFIIAYLVTDLEHCT